ncbi:MAG: class I SAM-dependent methyltransferase [Pseudomonadota bacterium]
MTPPLTYEFAARFARFLCGLHHSFAKAARKMPEAWEDKNKAPVQQFLFDRLLPLIPTQGPILEFGVYKGVTLSMIAQGCPDHQIFGFDSFKGLPNDGRRDWRMKFKQETPPKVAPNVELITGYFEDTLPEFAKVLTDPPALIHIDCDLFSSTHTILNHLRPQVGQIILFDELIHYARFAMNEVLALFMYLEKTGLDIEWVCPIGEAFDYAASGGQMRTGGMAGHRRAGYFQNQAVRLTQARRHFTKVAPEAVIDNIQAQLRQHYGDTSG